MKVICIAAIYGRLMDFTHAFNSQILEGKRFWLYLSFRARMGRVWAIVFQLLISGWADVEPISHFVENNYNGLCFA